MSLILELGKDHIYNTIHQHYLYYKFHNFKFFKKKPNYIEIKYYTHLSTDLKPNESLDIFKKGLNCA